jgi:hypothetical protein
MQRFSAASSLSLYLRVLLVGLGALLLAGATLSSSPPDGRHRKAMCASRLMHNGNLKTLVEDYIETYDDYVGVSGIHISVPDM